MNNNINITYNNMPFGFRNQTVIPLIEVLGQIHISLEGTPKQVTSGFLGIPTSL